jgi:hypothetical protein
VRFCKVQNAVHLTGLAAEMNGHNGLETGAMLTLQLDDALFKMFHVDIECICLNVNEHGMRTQVARHFRSGGECPSGHQHKIVRANAHSFHGEMQPARCRIDGQGMPCTHCCREGLLELLCPGTGGQPATSHASDDRLNFLFTNARQGKGNEILFIGVISGHFDYRVSQRS